MRGTCIALFSVCLLLCGCDSNTAVLDQSPIRNYVVVPIVNDTDQTIRVTLCYSRTCRGSGGHDITDTLSPHTQREDAVNNSYTGPAVFRVTTPTTTRCLYMSYALGQEHHAALLVSNSRPCP